MSYEILERTDELMLSHGKTLYCLCQVELQNNNFFINLVFTEGCLIITSNKMHDMLYGCTWHVVSYELKRKGQKKPHKLKKIRRCNGKNKKSRKTKDHVKRKIEQREPH